MSKDKENIEKDWNSIQEQEQEQEQESEEEVTEEKVTEEEKPTSKYGDLTHAQLLDKITELEGLEDQAKEHEDKALRAQAELQNVLQRAEREKTKARQFALESFAAELIAVVDNLEHALETFDPEDDAAKTAHEGVELTHKNFLDILAKHGITQINPDGEKFNPDLHEAMSMQEDKKVKSGNVITVFQKGYTLHDRLIRPARVVVSK